MIETRPGVSVDAQARWMFQGNEVTHDGVLAYFKANLYLENEVYSILNRHGENLEKAVLDSVLNFPLFAVSLASGAAGMLALVLDTHEQIEIQQKDLLFFGEDILFFFHPERGVPVRLRASAMTHAMNEVDEVNGGYRWKSGDRVSIFSGTLFKAPE